MPEFDVGEDRPELNQVEQQPEPLDVRTDAYDGVEGSFNPIEFAEEDDEF